MTHVLIQTPLDYFIGTQKISVHGAYLHGELIGAVEGPHMHVL
jgi:hypothetical protein